MRAHRGHGNDRHTAAALSVDEVVQYPLPQFRRGSTTQPVD
jgi:hypothetical protein